MNPNSLLRSLLAVLLSVSPAKAVDAAVSPNLEGVKRIVFLGDSITQGGDYVTGRGRSAHRHILDTLGGARDK